MGGKSVIVSAERVRGYCVGLGVCLLVACASPGPAYEEVMGSAAPVAADKVRLVFLRPADPEAYKP